MIPKHHFLVHYPSVMKKVGPLWGTCCMWYEAKHQESKIAAHSAKSGVDVCHTIAVRHQLKLNCMFLNQNVKNHFEWGPITLIKTLNNFSPHIYTKLMNSGCSNKISTLKWLKRLGHEIHICSIYVIPRESGSQSFEVTDIISEKSNIFIISKTILESYFQAHFEAYEITSSSYEWDVFSLNFFIF